VNWGIFPVNGLLMLLFEENTSKERYSSNKKLAFSSYYFSLTITAYTQNSHRS